MLRAESSPNAIKIKVARKEEQEQAPNHDERQDELYVGPTAGAETAREPEYDLAHGVDIGRERKHRRDNRADKGLHCYPCEDHRCQRVNAPRGSQHVHQHHGAQRAQKGQCRGRQIVQAAETKVNSNHRAQRSTRGNSNDTGVGKRIAKDTLHSSACHRQRRAYQRRRQHTRQAHVADDAPLHVGSRRAERNAHLLQDNRSGNTHRHVHSANRHGHHKRQEQQQHEHTYRQRQPQRQRRFNIQRPSQHVIRSLPKLGFLT